MVRVADAPLEINFPSMSDAEFLEFCQRNKDLRIERDKDGNVTIMAPTFSLTGIYESIVHREVSNWNAKTKSGWVFSPSAGFTLPNGAMRGADTSWIANEKWNLLSKKEKNSFAPICPDFVVEIRSSTDKLKALQAKMEEWIENGAQLAWLIDPEKEKAWIYSADGSTTAIKGFDAQLSGENILPEYIFDLSLLRI